MEKKQDECAVLKFKVPKGHLGDKVATILRKTGYVLPNYPKGRIYRGMIEGGEIKMTVGRAMDIALDLVRGDTDIGITGFDFLSEFPGAKLLLDLQEPVTQWVLAVSGMPELGHICDLQGFYAHLQRENVTIHTKLPHFVQNYFASCPSYQSICSEPPALDLGRVVFPSSSPINIRRSAGCTEGNDFFVDCVNEGNTLRMNGCKRIHTVMKRSTPWLAVSPHALGNPSKELKIREIYSRLKSVLDSASMGIGQREYVESMDLLRFCQVGMNRLNGGRVT